MNTQIPKTLSPTLERFSKYIQHNREQVDTQIFAEEFGKIQKNFLKAKQRDTFCTEAEVLAERMLAEKQNEFASIILSSLCKLTQFIPEQLENFAWQGYEVAKRNGDTVHMMARLNDLRKIYYRKPDKLHLYLKVLFKLEKCLKELTTNYETTVNSYNTIFRQPANKKDYELMLAHVRTELGKLIKRKQPTDAAEKLLAARETFEKRNYNQHLEYIDMLLDEIKI